MAGSWELNLTGGLDLELKVTLVLMQRSIGEAAPSATYPPATLHNNHIRAWMRGNQTFIASQKKGIHKTKVCWRTWTGYKPQSIPLSSMQNCYSNCILLVPVVCDCFHCSLCLVMLDLQPRLTKAKSNHWSVQYFHDDSNLPIWCNAKTHWPRC